MTNILILGGCGFVGRNLVQYLVGVTPAVGKIRVVDKQPPAMAGMNDEQKALYASDRVEFKQANLSNPTGAAKAFADCSFQVVVNLAAEGKYSQTPEVYKENIIEIVNKCTAEAKKAGVTKWIEVSDAQVYDAGKKQSKEGDTCKPWTKKAVAKLAAEEVVKNSGIPYIIIRPAVIYGPGDITGITPRIICAACYLDGVAGEKMEFLWEKDLKINTVHVKDVCSGIWHVINKGKAGEIYNLADSGDTDQGSVNEILEKIFGIKTGFMGFLKSKAATAVAMKQVADTANETHLQPWSDLCKKYSIQTTLSPYLDEELLYNNAIAVDGTKITKEGFTYSAPAMTEAHIREVISYFVNNKQFPAGLTK